MKQFLFKSDVSIDKDSMILYLDERTGELSIIAVVGIYTFFYIFSLNLISFQIIIIDSFILTYRILNIDSYGLKRHTIYMTCTYYWRKMNSAVLIGCFEIWRITCIVNSLWTSLYPYLAFRIILSVISRHFVSMWSLYSKDIRVTKCRL